MASASASVAAALVLLVVPAGCVGPSPSPGAESQPPSGEIALEDCEMHWAFLQAPAQSVARFLPVGFEAASAFGVEGEVDVTPRVVRCGTWRAGALALPEVALALQRFHVVPPEALVHPAGLHLLVPGAWVDGDGAAALLASWGVPALPASISVEGDWVATPGAGARTGASTLRAAGVSATLATRVDTAQAGLFAAYGGPTGGRLFVVDAAGPARLVAIVDFAAGEPSSSGSARGSADLSSEGGDLFPCEPCSGLGTHDWWTGPGVVLTRVPVPSGA